MNNQQALQEIASIISQTGINLTQQSQDDIEYDENGFSEMTEHGGVRVKDVDKLIKSWANSGDPVKQLVAEKQDRFYVWEHDNVNYTKEQFFQINSNRNRLFGVGPMVDDYYKMRGLYFNKETEQDSFFTPSVFEQMSGKWERIRNRLKKRSEDDDIGEVIDHAIVTAGNNSDPKSPNYNSFVKNIPKYVQNHMESHEARLRSSGTRRPRQ